MQLVLGGDEGVDWAFATGAGCVEGGVLADAVVRGAAQLGQGAACTHMHMQQGMG